MTTINMFAVSAGMGKFMVTRRGKAHTRNEPMIPDDKWYIRLFHSSISANSAIIAWRLGIWENGEDGSMPEITRRKTSSNRMKTEFTIVPVEVRIDDQGETHDGY